MERNVRRDVIKKIFAAEIMGMEICSERIKNETFIRKILYGYSF